jgi:ABC-type nitrate/sulfonate/bicarbonate transport system permease component
MRVLRLSGETSSAQVQPVKRLAYAPLAKKLILLIARFAGIPIVLLIWEGVSRSGLFNAGLFPPPTKVAVALLQMILSGELLVDAAASGQRMLLGYLAGSVLGVVFGTITGRFELGRNFFAPIIQMLRPIPPISLVPIAVLWFGLGEFAKYFLVFWGVFFIVWITSHLGLLAVDKTYINAARSLGATERVVLVEVAIPAAMPAVLAGLRTAIPVGFYSLVAGEVAGATHGLAYMIELAHTNFQVAKMFGGLVILGLASACADRVFVFVTSMLFPWAYKKEL